MAASKDKRSVRLFALQLQARRRARRADKRRRKALRHAKRYKRRLEKATTDMEIRVLERQLKEARRDARNARDVARRQRRKVRQFRHDRRARRRSLRHRLHLKARSGTVYFEGKEVAAWIGPILQAARRTGLWHGGVSSGFRSYAKQWWIYFVARIRPAAYPGTSNHEGSAFPKGAIDTNDPWGLRRALQKIGRYGSGSSQRLQGFSIPRDPWHFSSTGR
jgi:hypothetical protein